MTETLYHGNEKIELVSNGMRGAVRMTKRLEAYEAGVQRVYHRTGRCTIRDLGEEMGVTSTSTVCSALMRLRLLGKVRHEGLGVHKSYKPSSAPSTDAINNLLNGIRQRLNDGYAMPGWLDQFKEAWQ